VIWKVVERIITYVFVLCILYMLSQTALQWNRDRQLDLFKQEIRKELEDEIKDLQKDIIRQEVKGDNTNLALTSRLNVLEEAITKINNKENK